MKHLHKAIRHAIQAALDTGDTQAEIAKACGVKPATLYKYLNSEPTPDLETVQKFSRWMGVSLDMLVSEGSPTPYGLKSNPRTMRLHAMIEQLAPDEIALFERMVEKMVTAQDHRAPPSRKVSG